MAGVLAKYNHILFAVIYHLYCFSKIIYLCRSRREWKESDGLSRSGCTMGTEEKTDPIAAGGSKQPGFPGCRHPWTPATLTTFYALNIGPHMHFAAALAVAQQYTFYLLTKKLPVPCLLALTTPLLELCNTHTCHTGLNTKILGDWQPPKQCGLSRDRNDRNGSWFAGISVERTDSQIKDGGTLESQAGNTAT